MRFSNGTASFEEVNRKDMADYLSKLGFEPASKRKGYEYWYHSPINLPDKTPSFKLDTRTNRWRDFSLGKGGSLVDFGMLYHGCSASEFLEKFESPLSLGRPIAPHIPKPVSREQEEASKIKILGEKKITSPGLIGYLTSRCIDLDLAREYCREVNFELYHKQYYAIGFKNNSGGFELRNAFFKGSSSPKDATTIGNNGEEISVFEGFFNFLSYEMLRRKFELPPTDYQVLNSLVFFEKSREAMERYRAINLYLDRGPSGEKQTAMALKLPSNYNDRSGMFLNYGDLNDFWVSFVQNERQFNPPKRSR